MTAATPLQYSVNVTSHADAVVGIAFTEKNNIRLIVGNTGHEYVPFDARAAKARSAD